jgi:hypothetical protein
MCHRHPNHQMHPLILRLVQQLLNPPVVMLHPAKGSAIHNPDGNYIF